MRVSELFVITAYTSFLSGSARSFRTGADLQPRFVMTSAVLLDMLFVALPSIDLVSPLTVPATRMPLVFSGVWLGVFVWMLFAVAMVL